MGLLRAYRAGLDLPTRSRDRLQQAAAEIADRLHPLLRELREGEIHAHREHNHRKKHRQSHAAVGDGLPRYMDSWFVTRRHKGHRTPVKP